MKPQFVTALYTGLEGTIFNGNSIGIHERYCESLKSLARGGYGIICYTSSPQYDELVQTFSEYRNVKFVVSELKMNPFHDQINSIKGRNPEYTTSPSWRSRCVEIMWGKFLWVNSCLHLIDDEDSLFWIDAGLFHGGLFPNSLRSENSLGVYDFDIITQKQNLYDELNRYSDGKILNILSSTINHGSEDYRKVFSDTPEYAVVGGVFGGRKHLLQHYVESAQDLMFEVLSHGVLIKEEEFMYKMHKTSPELYTNFQFDTWYHQDWGDELYNPEFNVSFSDFFRRQHA